MEYRNAPKKKVKTRPYSILTQKSKDSTAFDEQKVKNIAIEYRLQLIFSNPDCNKRDRENFGDIIRNLVILNGEF